MPQQNLLIAWNISPNQITLFTCLCCIIYAAFLSWSPFSLVLLLLLPLFMFFRMALNALDGMVAAKTNTQSETGMVLNEICDVISDAALFSAFLLLLPAFKIVWWFLLILVLLTEFVSLAVFQVTHIRSHNGPFGKSDRAVYLSLLALMIFAYPALLNTPSPWVFVYILFGLILAALTIWNRCSSLLK